MRSIRQTRTRPGQSWSSRAGGGRTAMRRISILPCSLSIVSARSRSGGSTRRFGVPGSAATREGEIVAEGVRDLGLEFGLIGFDEQEIAGPLGPDCFNDRSVGEGGIATLLHGSGRLASGAGRRRKAAPSLILGPLPC